MKHPRRPPSQCITEVSDEGSNGPSSASNPNRNDNGNVGTNPSPRTPFPTIRAANGTQETSSKDEEPAGPFKIVENDPFEVIRKSMLGPSPSVPHWPVPSVPSAEPSRETSPSRTAFPSVGAGAGRGTGLTPDPGAAKRERRTSKAFFWFPPWSVSKTEREGKGRYGMGRGTRPSRTRKGQ